MKIVITGSANEIAAFAMQLQRQRERELCPEIARREFKEEIERLTSRPPQEKEHQFV